MNYPITDTELDLSVSTWGQDCARGLLHPESVAARRLRIEEAEAVEAKRIADLHHGLRLVSANLSGKEADILLLLHVASGAVAKHHSIGSYLYPVVTGLDKVADSIEFPEGA